MHFVRKASCFFSIKANHTHYINRLIVGFGGSEMGKHQCLNGTIEDRMAPYSDSGRRRCHVTVTLHTACLGGDISLCSYFACTPRSLYLLRLLCFLFSPSTPLRLGSTQPSYHSHCPNSNLTLCPLLPNGDQWSSTTYPIPTRRHSETGRPTEESSSPYFRPGCVSSGKGRSCRESTRPAPQHRS